MVIVGGNNIVLVVAENVAVIVMGIGVVMVAEGCKEIVTGVAVFVVSAIIGGVICDGGNRFSKGTLMVHCFIVICSLRLRC